MRKIENSLKFIEAHWQHSVVENTGNVSLTRICRESQNQYVIQPDTVNTQNGSRCTRRLKYVYESGTTGPYVGQKEKWKGYNRPHFESHMSSQAVETRFAYFFSWGRGYWKNRLKNKRHYIPLALWLLYSTILIIHLTVLNINYFSSHKWSIASPNNSSCIHN